MTLIDEFLQDAPKTFDSEIKRTKGQVFEVSGQTNCLFYIKTRQSIVQNWGITKNVIDWLKKQKRPWFVLLLSPSTIPSYILTSDEVDNYVKHRRLNKDGDYKTSPTFPDENTFTTLGQLKNKIEKIIPKTEDEILNNEVTDTISATEGGEKVVISRQAERNPALRNEAIKIHGLVCKACGFNFATAYGDWGQGFIEVHHISPLGQTKNIKVKTDPKNDLTVLCSNCHRMAHRKRGTTLTIDELKDKIKN